MSFHTPKAIQNVGIFYCYTGQNMIPKKKYFPSHYRHCSWLIFFVMTYGQYRFISLYNRFTISKLPISRRLLFIVSGKKMVYSLYPFINIIKEGMEVKQT